MIMKRNFSNSSFLISLFQHKQINSNIRFLSTKEACERRNHLFTLEKKRQFDSIGRIEKIEVRYKGIPKDVTLIMNKDISTPHDCARHLSEWHADSSALALVNDTVYWDIHKPLIENCTLQLQNYNSPDPQAVNRAYWRTCAFLLGACASVAFKESVPVYLHSFPGPDIRSGSFVYDVDLPELPDWEPTEQELRALSAEYVKFSRRNYVLERLDVSEDLALEMFTENPHKSLQIPDIAKANGRLTLYRAGKHVDISKGPMISNTSHIGRVTVPAVHRINKTGSDVSNTLFRFQGVSLPNGSVLNHFAYDILVKRAKKLNPTQSPFSSFGKIEERLVA